MEEIQKYIESGVLEQYCLGLLNEEEKRHLIQMAVRYPEIKAELDAIERSVEQLAAATAVEPPLRVKQNILATLGFDSAATGLDITDLPVIDQSVDPLPWLHALAHLMPDEPVEGFIAQVIRDDNLARQILVITSEDVAEEEHDNLRESFFVLKGHCECTIGDHVYALGPGDFIEIPLNKKHNVRLVTPVVTAVLQYRFA
ncbi:MAG: cupin domain-containing protein [Mucilaginibacter sp.]